MRAAVMGAGSRGTTARAGADLMVFAMVFAGLPIAEAARVLASRSAKPEWFGP
jgi:hypothetical protein